MNVRKSHVENFELFFFFFCYYSCRSWQQERRTSRRQTFMVMSFNDFAEECSSSHNVLLLHYLHIKISRTTCIWNWNRKCVLMHITLFISSQEVRWEGKVIVCECLCYEFVYTLNNGKPPSKLIHTSSFRQQYMRTTSRQQVIPSFRLSFTFRRESCSSKKFFFLYRSLSLSSSYIHLSSFSPYSCLNSILRN